MVGEAAHQRALHFARAGAVTLGVQFVGAREQLSGVHVLQAGLELLLGACSLFALALLLGLCCEPGLLGGLAGGGLACGRQIDLGANTGHVVLRAHRQLAVLVAAFFGQRAIGAVLTSLCAPVGAHASFETCAVGARKSTLEGCVLAPCA
ncbi:hypothetical protein D3C85_994150 [compost metagenome]